MRFAKFHKVNLPSIRGTYDPNAAGAWIKEMEKIFSILTYTKEQKISFFAFILKVDAEFWWNGIRNLMENDGTPINWEVFKTAFNENYFAAFVRNAKELEFMQLR